MVYTFDILGYAKRLRENGVPQNQAEAHAEAARDFINGGACHEGRSEDRATGHQG